MIGLLQPPRMVSRKNLPSNISDKATVSEITFSQKDEADTFKIDELELAVE